MWVLPWGAVFAGAAAVVTLTGVQLARAGDQIAERAGLSKLFVGMLLVAGATSLPEIATNVSASLADAPDLAVGNVIGSSLANMAILAVVDLLTRHRVWPQVEVGHARLAAAAIALTALAALGLLTPEGPAIGWVGADTVAIAVAYLAGIAWLRRSPTGRFAEGGVLPVPTGWTGEAGDGLRRATVRFVLATAGILASAPLLAYSGREIAVETGLGEGFVGSSLLAASTSMPELVASIAAVRVGAHDLAVGNLFGSNAFNMASLLFADVAYTDAPLLSAVAADQAVGAVGAVLLMALALTAIVHGTETRVRRLEPDAVLLLVAYAGTLFAVWSVGA